MQVSGFLRCNMYSEDEVRLVERRWRLSRPMGSGVGLGVGLAEDV